MKTNEATTCHTPGPWKIEGIGESRPDKPYEVTGNRSDVGGVGCIIAYVVQAYTSESTWRHPILSSESSSNAQLIAAAPDLLEAAMTVFATVCYGTYPDGMGQGEGAYIRIADHDPAFKLLRDAIAKAEEGGK